MGELVMLSDVARATGISYYRLYMSGRFGEIPVRKIGRGNYMDRADIAASEKFIREKYGYAKKNTKGV
ncbi:MAG: hypothetical protein U0871_04045 [Gemmataceae bacterium]